MGEKEKSLASKRVSLASNHENSHENSIYTAKSENNHSPKRIVSHSIVCFIFSAIKIKISSNAKLCALCELIKLKYLSEVNRQLAVCRRKKYNCGLVTLKCLNTG